MKTIIHQFLEQAERNPAHVAVLDIQGAITYDRMNNLSAYLAERILEGIGGKDCRGRIALLLPRSKAFVVAQFAVLRAGCAVVPIDAEYPAERVRLILEDVGCALCVTTAELAEKATGYPVLRIEEIFPESGNDPKGDKTLNLSDPDVEGYILYTSGSTGKPKGVVHRQAMLSCAPTILAGQIPLTEETRSLNIAGFSFIAGLLDIMPVLTSGGSVYIANETERKNMDRIWELFSEHQITGMFMPPQMYNVLRKLHGPLPLKYVLLGGEKATGEQSDPGVLEIYGATETGYVLMHPMTDGSSASLGKPCRDTEVYLLDEAGNKIEKAGEIGELCVSSPWLALGYHNMPAETAERFVDCPFAPEKRMFCTGDYMAYDETGELVFHGRKDHMVKIRGYRVELGEVERTAAEYPGISRTAAVVKNNLLCLYYTSDDTLDEAALKLFIANRLAEYMIPGCFVRLEKMPLNPNGKLDRKALPDPKHFDIRQTDYEAPINETELALCTAFENVIGLERSSVGRFDDFFSIGGDSLRAVEVMSMAGLEELNARMIFQHKTAAGIAEELAVHKTRDMAGYEAEARKMRLPITLGQTLMIDDLFENVHSTMYNLSGFFRLDAQLDAERLAKAVDRAVIAHPGLCSVFDFDEEGQIIQFIQPGILAPTKVEDVSQQELETLTTTLQKPFRIFRTPLFRSSVFRCEGVVYLFVDMLHTVSDGSSLSVLYRDIARAYWGEELFQDYFYSYVRREAEIRGTDAFEKAKGYFADILGDRNWCRIPTPDKDAWDTLCASESVKDVLTLEQMEQAEKRTGYSRNVIAITAAMLALQEYCGEDRICVDYINNNRMERYLLNTVGLVYKTLPIAIDLSAFPTRASLLQEVNRQEIESFVYSVADYTAKEDLVAEDAIAINYVSDLGSVENLKGFNATELPLDNGEEEAMGGHADLYISESNGGISLQIDYLKNAYEERSIHRFLDVFIKHLKELVEERS